MLVRNGWDGTGCRFARITQRLPVDDRASCVSCVQEEALAVTSVSRPSAFSRQRIVATLTGLLCALFGLALLGGGAWLVALGGSIFYVILGIGLLIAGGLLAAGRRAGLVVYAVALIGTLIWAVIEVGFDWWPLAARGDILFPLGVWMLTPWVTRGLAYETSDVPAPKRPMTTLPLWGAVAAGVVVLAIGLTTTYHETDGRLEAAAQPAVAPPDLPQPDEDWRAYGRTQAGQRYSPLTQITPANVQNLKVAWTFRTGDLPDKKTDPIEFNVRGYADQGRQHAVPVFVASETDRVGC